MKKQTFIQKFNYIVYFGYHYLFDCKFRKLRRLHIKDNICTLEYILRNQVSVSRFGDGELKLISGKDTDFQKVNPEMLQKLKEVIHSNANNHIVCLPHPWKSLFTLDFKYSVFEYWSSYLNLNLETEIFPFVDFDRQYYDTNFTRFYIDYRNDKNARRVIPLLKQIWKDKRICIIEGEYSRLGVGNDLFDNAACVERIICPSTNAFSVYDRIISIAKEQPKDTLLLIALGMTATCLSYDLSLCGYWAIDIGHVDVEYEWFKMKAKGRVPIKNKYVAESKERYITDSRVDKLYESQIIAKIL